jgi:hypothetical protein
MTTPDNNDKLLPILELDELVEIFEYTNVRAARRAIRLKKFPVPVFELAGRTVAHEDAVELFMKRMRDEALDAMS